MVLVLALEALVAMGNVAAKVAAHFVPVKVVGDGCEGGLEAGVACAWAVVDV